MCLRVSYKKKSMTKTNFLHLWSHCRKEPDPDPDLLSQRYGFGSSPKCLWYTTLPRARLNGEKVSMHKEANWKTYRRVQEHIARPGPVCWAQHPPQSGDPPQLSAPAQQHKQLWERHQVTPNCLLSAVLRIHDILGWIQIRIRGSMPLTNGSGFEFGSWIRFLLFSSLTFKMSAKNLIF